MPNALADKKSTQNVASDGDSAACKNPPKKTTSKSADPAKSAPAPKEPTTDESKAPEPAPKEPTTDKSKVADPEKKTENLPEVTEKTEDDEPEPRVYTPEEIEEIAAKVETYKDQTPKYNPKHMLSPEFVGTSNYERAIAEFRKEKLAEIKRLGNDNSNTADAKISDAKEKIRVLDHLYENYHLGMNVFRTAKGGRAKLRV